MILIVGASGRLGSTIARRVLAEGKPVRAMSREPSKLAALDALGADVVAGDLRDPASLARACQGVHVVFAAAHAFDGKGNNNPATVDEDGNRNLIAAAQAAGVRHVVFTSIRGVRPDHPVDLFRHKYAAEEALRASGLSCTILRPTAFMELWATIIAEPIVRRGTALIFGRGTNPINFVSVEDVAHVATLGLEGPDARNRTIEIGGPENLSMLDAVQIIERVTGRTARRRHIPRAAMWTVRALTRPINPAFSRQIRMGIFMDTEDMTFDPAALLTHYPLRLARLEDVVRGRYGAGVRA